MAMRSKKLYSNCGAQTTVFERYVLEEAYDWFGRFFDITDDGFYSSGCHWMFYMWT